MNISLIEPHIPLISIFFSLLIFFGLVSFGFLIIKKSNLESFFLGDKYILFFSPLLSISIFSVLLYYLSLIGFFNKFTVWFITLLLVISVIYSFKKVIKYFKVPEKNFFLLYIFIFFIFITALSPTTDADALDYHVAVAQFINSYGYFPNFKFWFHSNQAGAGEAIIAYGFYFQAVELGKLIQFSGLLPLLAIFTYILEIKKKKLSIRNLIFILLFFSTPIFFPLYTSIKPQLFCIGVSSVIFFNIFFRTNILLKEDSFKYIFIILFLLFTNFIHKFSFLLSSFILSLSLFLIIALNKKKKNLKFFFISSFLIIILILPIFLWKNFYFETSIFSFITSPFNKDLFGYSSFHKSIVSYGYNFFYGLFIPNSLGAITQTLGFGLIFFFYTKKLFIQNKMIIGISFCYFLIILIFGKHNPRFILEPYIWVTILIFYSYVDNNIGKSKIVTFFSCAQIFIVCIVLVYFNISNTFKSFSLEGRNTTMVNYANGYKFSRLIDSILNNDNTIIFLHRSISLPNVKVVPIDFINYIDLSREDNLKNSMQYFLEIKNFNPEYIAFEGNKNLKKNKHFSQCFGKLLKYEKNFSNLASRNPFNKNKQNQDVYVYKLLKKKFPGCIKNH